MHEVALYGKEKHLHTLPSTWDELSVEHVPAVILARALAWKDEYAEWMNLKVHATRQKPPFTLRGDHAGLRFQLFQALAGIPSDQMALMPPAADLTFQVKRGPQLAWVCLPQLDWLFGQPVRTTSWLPTVTVGGVAYKGPGDSLNELSCDQWMWADTLLQAYQQTEEPAAKQAAMHNVLGALYQPVEQKKPNKEGNPEWYFSSLLIEQHAAALAALTLDQKLVALFNYEALRNALPAQYTRVFAGGGGATPPSGTFYIANKVGEKGVYGTIPEVKSTRMHDVLHYMEDNLFDDEQAANAAKATTSKP